MTMKHKADIRHVVDVAQFDRPALERLFAAADRMRELPAALRAAGGVHAGDDLLRAFHPHSALIRNGDAPPRR